MASNGDDDSVICADIRAWRLLYIIFDVGSYVAYPFDGSEGLMQGEQE